MKKQLLLLALLLPAIFVGAQTPPPGSFAWQATLRSPSGEVLANQEVDIRLSILDGSPSGAVLYQEEHKNVRSNAYGIVQLAVGGGSRTETSDEFSKLDWPNKTGMYVKAEVKRSGDAGEYAALTATPLRSLPYALYTNYADTTALIDSIYESSRAQEVGSAVNIAAPQTMGGKPIFAVLNSVGDTVFAVYEDGIRAAVASTTRSSTGGFVVHSRSAQRTTQPLMLFTPDSARFYIDDSPVRGTRGGFAVAGFDSRAGNRPFLEVQPSGTEVRFNPDARRGTRGGFAVAGFDSRAEGSTDYLAINADSARVYFSEQATTARGTRGGFAVAGFDSRANGPVPMMLISPDTSRFYINEEQARGTRGGFAVAGFDSRAGESKKYMSISTDLAEIRSDATVGNNLLTNQVMSTFDVGGISQQVQDYTSYMTVDQQQTTAAAVQVEAEPQYDGARIEGYNPDVAVDANGFKYAIAKVGNYRWMRTNLRETAADSLTGSRYETYAEVCPTGWHRTTMKDWEFLRDYTQRTFQATEITADLLNDKYGLYFPVMAGEWGTGTGVAAFFDYSADKLISIGNEGFRIEDMNSVTLNGEKFAARCVEGGSAPEFDMYGGVEIPEVGAESMLLNGKLESNGGMPLSSYGFVVYFEGEKYDSVNLASTGEFRYRLTGLTPGTDYEIKPFAENHLGITFDGARYVQTMDYPWLMVVDDVGPYEPREDAYLRAECNAIDNHVGVVRYGFCYSTRNTMPTISSSRIDYEGSCVWQSFDTTIVGTPGDTTYIRAYVLCSNGKVIYSDDVVKFYTPHLPAININLNAQTPIGFYWDYDAENEQYTEMFMIPYSTRNLGGLAKEEHYDVSVYLNSTESQRDGFEIGAGSAKWGMQGQDSVICIPRGLLADMLFAKDITKDVQLTMRLGIALYDHVEYMHWDKQVATHTLRGVTFGYESDVYGTHYEAVDFTPGSHVAVAHVAWDGDVLLLRNHSGYLLEDYLVEVHYGTSKDNLDRVATIDGGLGRAYGDINMSGFEPGTTYYAQPVLLQKRSNQTDNTELLRGPVKSFTTKTLGSLTDSRDGKTYRTFFTRDFEWMMDDLAYTAHSALSETSNGPLSDQPSSNAEYYITSDNRVIYNMIAVQQIADTLCPIDDGWRIPKNYDVNELFGFMGMGTSALEGDGILLMTAGTYSAGQQGAGTVEVENITGFSAVAAQVEQQEMYHFWVKGESATTGTIYYQPQRVLTYARENGFIRCVRDINVKPLKPGEHNGGSIHGDFVWRSSARQR